MHVAVHQEIEYATWISARMAELIMKAEELKRLRKEEQKVAVKKLAKKKEKLLCVYCDRETKRHLEFCPTCGKQQVTFKIVPLN
jgi:rubrerythrin